MASGALSEKRDSQLKLNFLSQFRRVGQSHLPGVPSPPLQGFRAGVRRKMYQG
jgi:hypothetical protein